MEDSLHHSKAAFFPQKTIVDPLQEHLDLRIQLKEILKIIAQLSPPPIRVKNKNLLTTTLSYQQ